MDPNVDLYELYSWLLSLPSNHVVITANLAVIILLVVLNMILLGANKLIGPTNYEKDMTTKEYCKSLAELDNSASYLNTRHNRFSHLGLVEQPNVISSSFHNHHNHQDSSNKSDFELINGRKSSSPSSPLSPYSSLNSMRSPPTPTSIMSSSSRSSHSGDTGSGADHEQLSSSSNLTYSNSNCNENKLVNGWIPVLESMKLGCGKVKKVKVFGRDLIVTRSHDGRQVNVLDAYCPHAGVHIGVGGRVKQVNDETCVECPFHGWAFRTMDGQCVDIPYQRSNPKRCKIPKQAKLASWTCAEVDNFIYVWHHMDGEAPSWHLESSEEITSGRYKLNYRTYHKSNLDLFNMHENGADMFHFSEIHQDFFGFGGKIQFLEPIQYFQHYIKHTWEPQWKPIVDQHGKHTHKAQIKVTQNLQMFGKLNLFPASVVATQIGPAVVKLRYTTVLGDGLLTMNSIPIGGRRVKYIQHLYTNDNILDRIMGKLFMKGETIMLERDLMIWNHKKNMKNYILIPEDRDMKLFKLWYSQFYKRKRKIVIQNSSPDSHIKNYPGDFDLITCGKLVDF